ncbi:Mitochondrial inner membrane protease atp23 [Rhizophlyctis rosea]|nr:Mitochondrial inner membrane protease atp23 [Rhizophlyctis rosea]
MSSFTTRTKDEMIASSMAGAVVGGGLGYVWRGPYATPAGAVMYGLIAAIGQAGVSTWHHYRLNKSFFLESGGVEVEKVPWYTKLKQLNENAWLEVGRTEPDPAKSKWWDPVNVFAVWVKEKVHEHYGEPPEWATPYLNAFDVEYRKRLNIRAEILEGQVIKLQEQIKTLKREIKEKTEGVSAKPSAPKGTVQPVPDEPLPVPEQGAFGHWMSSIAAVTGRSQSAMSSREAVKLQREEAARLKDEERAANAGASKGVALSIEEERFFSGWRDAFSVWTESESSSSPSSSSLSSTSSKSAKDATPTPSTTSPNVVALSAEEERTFSRWRSAFGAVTGSSSNPSPSSSASSSPSSPSSSTPSSKTSPTDLTTPEVIHLSRSLTDTEKAAQQKSLAKCEKWKSRLLQNSPIIRFMLSELEKSGCPLSDSHFRCSPCPENRSGGFAPDFGVVLCAGHLMTRKRMEDTMVHELVHAYDHCTTKVDWGKCEHYACSEIRAAALSGDCKWDREVNRGILGWRGHLQTCVKRRAISNLKQLPQCQGEQVAEDAVRAVFHDCFADTAPFDEIY